MHSPLHRKYFFCKFIVGLFIYFIHIFKENSPSLLLILGALVTQRRGGSQAIAGAPRGETGTLLGTQSQIPITGFPHVLVGIPGGSRTALFAARHFGTPPITCSLPSHSHAIIGCLPSDPTYMAKRASKMWVPISFFFLLFS